MKIELKNVCKSFNKNKVIKNVSMTLEVGIFMAFMAGMEQGKVCF